jgi:uncharacterized protein (TIGR00369 family)
MRISELQHLLDQSAVHRVLRIRAEDDMSENDGSEDAPEEVRFRCQPGPEHAAEDGAGFLHGGVIATLLDTAATFVLIQASGADWATVDLRIDYLRPAPCAELLIKGFAVHVGTRLGRATAELSVPGGGILATAAGTFTRLQPFPERP